jgi:hypothetical protein
LQAGATFGELFPMPKAPANAHPVLKTAEEAYAYFLKEALALDPREVITARIDPALAGHNFRSAATAIEAVWDRVTKVLVAPDPTIVALALPLSLALEKADREAFDLASDGKIASKLTRVYEVRTLLFAAADLGKAFGIVDAATVKRIRAGKGPVDATQDLADLVPLFPAAVRAKIPMVDEALLAEASALHAELYPLFKPTGAKSAKSLSDAKDLRNRFFTLVAQRHETLWMYGACVWGREVDDHVSTLGAHQRSSAASTPAEPPKFSDPALRRDETKE